MEMKEFANLVKNLLEARTGKEIRLDKMKKNNGVVMDAVGIVEGDSNVMPVIYLETLLARYNEEECIDNIIEEIVDIHNCNKMQAFDTKGFLEFDNVRDKIVFKLINYADNKVMLNQIPHEKIMDLALVYYIIFEMGGTDDIGRIMVKSEYLEMWGIDEQELKSLAEANTPRQLPIGIESIHEILGRHKREGYEVDWVESDVDEKMYVAYNHTKVYGAAALCYPYLLSRFAEKKGSDLVIIPSSVHELIIYIPDERDNIEKIKQTVYEVNRTVLNKEDILSDSVYWYDRQKQELSIL